MAKKKQPMQPVYRDEHKVARFQENAIVAYVIRNGNIDLNKIATMDFSKEDQQQVAQLIGYSLSGYSELSYVTDTAWERAVDAAAGAGITL